MVFIDKGVQVGPERRRAADTVEIHCREENKSRKRRGAVMVRTQEARTVGLVRLLWICWWSCSSTGDDANRGSREPR